MDSTDFDLINQQIDVKSERADAHNNSISIWLEEPSMFTLFGGYHVKGEGRYETDALDRVRFLGDIRSLRELPLHSTDYDTQKVIEISKDGSDLFAIVGGEHHGVLINRLPLERGHTWKTIARGITLPSGEVFTIPTAPILVRDGEPITYERLYSENMDLYSRFCGLDFSFLLIHIAGQQGVPEKSLEALYDRFKHDKDLGDYHSEDRERRWQALAQEVLTSRDKTISDLEKVIGAKHNHVHLGNFTVEFIRKDYYENMLSQGFNINSIPFDSEAFSFNPSVKIDNPDEWETVVRLIDMDRLVFTDRYYGVKDLTDHYSKVIETGNLELIDRQLDRIRNEMLHLRGFLPSTSYLDYGEAILKLLQQTKSALENSNSELIRLSYELTFNHVSYYLLMPDGDCWDYYEKRKELTTLYYEKKKKT